MDILALIASSFDSEDVVLPPPLVTRTVEIPAPDTVSPGSVPSPSPSSASSSDDFHVVEKKAKKRSLEDTIKFLEAKKNVVEDEPPKTSSEADDLQRLMEVVSMAMGTKEVEIPKSDEATRATQPKGKIWECAECHKTFGNKFLLNKHIFIHTGLKPFKCDDCHKAFNRKDNLHRHRKSTNCHAVAKNGELPNVLQVFTDLLLKQNGNS